MNLENGQQALEKWLGGRLPDQRRLTCLLITSDEDGRRIQFSVPCADARLVQKQNGVFTTLELRLSQTTKPALGLCGDIHELRS